MKRFLVFLAVVMVFSLLAPSAVFAQGNQHDNGLNVFIEPGNLNEGNILPAYVNDYRNRKTSVRTSYEWSSYKRVSNNIRTGKYGGSITATDSVTFGTSVSGNINGLGISTGTSVSSSKGYTLNVGPNKRVYMGFRVYYKVETGINEYYDAVTGKIISSNRYTVKIPQYGEYKLINY